MKSAAAVPFLLVLVALTCATRPFTALDLNLLYRVGDPVVSPDKTRYVYTVNVWDNETNKKTTNLYLNGINGTEPIRIAPKDYVADSNPVWADNGNTILFLSTRSGSNQIWQVHVTTPTTATRVSDFPIDIDTFKLSEDSKMIVFTSFVYPGLSLEETASRNALNAGKRTSAQTWDSLMYRRWDTFWLGTYSHVFTANLAQDSVTKSFYVKDTPVDHMLDLDSDCPSRPFGGAEEYNLSPDKTMLAYTTQKHKNIAWSTDLNVYLVNITSGTTSCVSCENTASDSQPVFSPDNKKLAFVSMKKDNYESDRTRLSIYDVDTAKTTFRISEDWEMDFGSMEWSSDQKYIYFLSIDKAEQKVFKYDISEKRGELVYGEHLTSGFNRIPCLDNKNQECLLFAQSSFEVPAEIYMTMSNGTVTRLSHHNDKMMSEFAMSKTINLTYKGANGDDVQAFLFKPYGFEEGKKYPLLLLIHGGPETPWEDNFHYRWNVQPFTSAGYAVVEPNIHGSGSFGDKFRESIIGDWGGKPYLDLMMLIDTLGEKYDWIDTTNVGGLGASYGGYMINWLNTQTDRFKCLVCHDGMFDVNAFYYYTDELYFVETEFLGRPTDVPTPEPYLKYNPARFAANMKTPQLVIHGSTDYRIPDVSGFAAFTALQRNGVESRLVRYPEENHWVMNPNNSINWHQEIIDWLSRFMNTTTKNE